jgi:3-phosphoshikimate 1-carboxyvinyltransferase
VASAQIKSAVLLAGLHAAGETTVIEPQPSRDHTERLLRAFGAQIEVAEEADGGRRITLRGQPELTGRQVDVPSDLSSAAFPLVAALIAADGRLQLPGIGLNPLRRGLIDSLIEMGARLTLANARDQGGEPVADIIAESSTLKGIDVPPERVPAMIDEFPILAAAAACAEGVTRMRGLAELRVKESDRLSAIAEGLNACGVAVAAGPDWIEVRGTGRPPAGGARIPVRMDHRIAMAFLVLGMASAQGVAIDDGAAIDTSFPAFVPLMNRLGARIALTNPMTDR